MSTLRWSAAGAAAIALVACAGGCGTPPADPIVSVPAEEAKAEPAAKAAADDALWSLDFSAGLPEGWAAGEAVAEGLPSGSRGAVRMAPTREGKLHAVSSHRVTEGQGMFEIREDTRFNYTFKVSETHWYQVMLNVVDSEGDFLANYFLNPAPLAAEVDEWTTVSAPVSDFKTGKDKSAPPPGARVSSFVIMSNRDIGLVADRIWATVGPPGK